jgi:hypothetical protein
MLWPVHCFRDVTFLILEGKPLSGSTVLAQVPGQQQLVKPKEQRVCAPGVRHFQSKHGHFDGNLGVAQAGTSNRFAVSSTVSVKVCVTLRSAVIRARSHGHRHARYLPQVSRWIHGFLYWDSIEQEGQNRWRIVSAFLLAIVVEPFKVPDGWLHS